MCFKDEMIFLTGTNDWLHQPKGPFINYGLGWVGDLAAKIRLKKVTPHSNSPYRNT